MDNLEIFEHSEAVEINVQDALASKLENTYDAQTFFKALTNALEQLKQFDAQEAA